LGLNIHLFSYCHHLASVVRRQS